MSREALIRKFEYDVEKRHYLLRLLLVIDQFFNVLLWNGSQDETISSHVGRRVLSGKANIFERILCRILSKLDNNHCRKSIGE